MISRTQAVPFRTSKYVCDLCLINISVVRGARPVTTRGFATATAHDASRARAQSFQQKRPTQTYRGPKSINSSRNGRLHSYSTLNTTAQAVTTGVAPLSHRRLISLSGPDAAKFLHGLITNNVDSTRLSPFYSAFLDARGRVLWDVFIWVWPELVAKEEHWACYIEVDAGEVEALKKHLKRHKLRSKLAIKDVPTEGTEGIRVWAAWGGAHERVKEWSEIAGLEDPRAPRLYRYLANADRETIVDGLQPVDEKFYHVERYIHGVAEGPHEIIREAALPMEVNVDLSGGIDFKKGCYVGQELTIRTKHTGVVRKRILPVRFQPGGIIDASPDVNLSLQQQPTSGAEIKALDEEGLMKKGRATGKIIAAIGNVGIATCRLENMTPMRVSAEGGTYKPGMQFGVEVDGKVVHVQPVLHDWFVRRKEVLWDREERKKARLVTQDSDELD